jgi:acyl-CoA synthetase (AMP-forming)/AMP-acid ligase II
MAWPDDPLPPIRHELHFGDRLVRCFVERPRSLYGLLEAAARRDPDAPALVEGGARLTYRDLARRAEQLAAGMAARGVRADDRVAVLLGNRVEFVVALFAAARLGAVVVPLSVRERGIGLRDMLANSGPRLLLYEADLADRLPEPASLSGSPLVRMAVGGAGTPDAPFEALYHDGAAAPAPHQPREEDVAVILYTAGTTGRPKGAMLTQLNIAHSVMHYALCRGLGREDRALLAVPADHAIGLIAVLLTMVHVGGSTAMMRAFKARQFLELMAAERVTVTGLVPAMYQLCLLEPDFAAFDLSCWRIGGCGGAPMPEAVIADLAERLPHLQLMNGYGATEATAAATQMPLGRTARRPGSVGQVVPCAEVRIMEEAGCEVASGEAGEIWIKGPMVVPGYFANDAATRDAFVAGFWRSGDIGALDEAGYLYVLDRRKDMINRGGHKVFSAEVESVLSAHPQVVEAAVVAHPDPVLGEKVHAFVTVRGEALDADELRAFCQSRLADYKVPEFVTIATEPLPRNALGKVQKQVLRRRIAEMIA